MGKSLILSIRLTLLLSNYAKSKKLFSPTDGPQISKKSLSVPEVTVPDVTVFPLKMGNANFDFYGFYHLLYA